MPQALAVEQDCWILPENAAALEVFDACHTQWNYLASMAGVFPTGLRYQDVLSVMRTLYPDEDARALFLKVQVMERAQLNLLQQ